MSFVDFYDFANIVDLGFGLKVCTDKGCLFVTYEGEAITTDEWDNFELNNGKLVAIKEGETTYDEWGDPIITSDGIVRTFDLPKK